MPVNTECDWQDVPRRHLRGRPREDPRVRRRRRRDQPAAPSTSRRPGPPATPTSSRRRCSPSSTPAARSARRCSTPRSASTSRMLVHGAQEFRWGPLVVAGDEIDDDRHGQGHLRPRRHGLLRVRVGVHQPARRDRLHRHVDQHRQGSIVSGITAGRRDRAEGHARTRTSRSATRARRATSTRSTSTRSSPSRSACRAGSCTACGRWRRSPAPHTEAAGGPDGARAALRSSSAGWACSAGDRRHGHGRARATAVSASSTPRREQGEQADHPQRRGRGRRVASAASRPAGRGQATPIPTIRRCADATAKSWCCARSSRATWRPACPWASKSLGATGSSGDPRRSATSWPTSRSWGCSPTRTPRPAGCPPRPATGTSSTGCCRPSPRRRDPLLAMSARPPRARRGDADDDRDALAGDQPAGDRHRAADRDLDDPPHRGARRSSPRC